MKKLLSTLAAVVLCTAVGVVALPSATAAETITTSWSVQSRSLADGRTYFVQVPACAPATAPECVAFMARPRQLVTFLHHAGGPEDATTATNWLVWFRYFHRDTIYVYAVTSGGSGVWDAGICCAKAPVDDVGYLSRVLEDVAAHWSVDRKRVGLMGNYNGGMLAERAACEQPAVFTAAASQAGTYAGPCAVGTTRVIQYHGGSDPVVPLEGGRTWVLGAWRDFPSASSLGKRMLQGSTFELQVFPGYGHGLPSPTYRAEVEWLTQHFPK